MHMTRTATLNGNPGTCALLAGTTYSFTPDNGHGWAMVDGSDPRLTLKGDAPMTTTALATYEVWYTTPHGEPMLAWQGLTQAQAWMRATELRTLGYTGVQTIYTGP